MTMTKCVECGRDVSDDARRCQGCGKKLKMSPLLPILGVIAALAIGLVGTALTKHANDPNAEAKDHDREAIQTCHEQYELLAKDPNMTRDALGFAYTACQKMESNYRTKWGYNP